MTGLPNLHPDTLSAAELQSGDVVIAYDHLPLVGDFNFSTAPVTLKKKSEIPNRVKLSQNYPNPYNNQTRIEFELPETRFVLLEVFNTAR